MIRVSLEGLVQRYDRVAVIDLDPVQPLEIAPGELFAVLGPGGAGKTTLARLIAGLETPDEGLIRFNDRPVQNVPPEERQVGVVFEDEALWPHLNVAENVAIGLKARGLSRRDCQARVEEVLVAARLDGLGQRTPGTLTPLQRRRVALARALVVEPRLLVFDEPSAGLDSRSRGEFLEQIARLRAESRTTTLVLTGEPRAALSLGDRVGLLDLGRILQVGTPSEVYNRPINSLVARFLGPINLIQGQTDSGDIGGEVVVRTPLGRLIGRADPGPTRPGQPVTVAIRPDALGFRGPAPTESNRFNATLERSTFEGEQVRLQLRGPGDWPLEALALQSQCGELRPGQSLTLWVPPEHVLVLPGRYVPPV